MFTVHTSHSLLILGALALAQSGSVQAQSPPVTLASLQVRLLADEGRLAGLQADNIKLASQVAQLKAENLQQYQQTRQLTAQVGVQASALNKLQIKTGSMTLVGTTLKIEGVNVQITDGTGSTASNSGLGNLTVGYNELGNFFGDFRTGSHNLIVGSQNSYSSYGGIVAGRSNSVLSGFSTVSGGFFNKATGFNSSVSGGHDNIAAGQESTVSGGTSNIASGAHATVSGGYNITADQYSQWAGGIYSTP